MYSIVSIVVYNILLCLYKQNHREYLNREMHYFVEGDYVAVNWNEKWVRGYIEKLDPSGEKNIVRLVDHGGYWVLNNSQFKPLMMDYLSNLPFQAIEIFIANIHPKNGNYIDAILASL